MQDLFKPFVNQYLQEREKAPSAASAFRGKTLNLFNLGIPVDLEKAVLLLEDFTIEALETYINSPKKKRKRRKNSR